MSDTDMSLRLDLIPIRALHSEMLSRGAKPNDLYKMHRGIESEQTNERGFFVCASMIQDAVCV